MYNLVIVGGTFDGLHLGHQALLQSAFRIGKQVLIGLTSDTYISKYKSSANVASYSQRLEQLKKWLSDQGLDDSYQINPLDDPFGPSITNSEAQALVVSEQTKTSAEEINKERINAHLNPLEIIVIPMVLSYDGTPISSTKIRSGEIDRIGVRIMPPEIRKVLEVPMGKVLVGDDRFESCKKHKDKFMIAVGDITTHTLIEKNFIPNLAIIDLSARRMPYNTLDYIPISLNYQMVHIQNIKGHIFHEAEAAIINAFRSNYKTIIIVKGEEDLLVLPCIIYAPLNSVLYYGQPPIVDQNSGQTIEGLVELEITQELKNQAQSLLSKFN